MQNFKRSRTLLLILALATTSACGTNEPENPPEVRDILEIAKSTGFELLPESEDERSFLELLLPEEEKAALRTVVLLRDGDRVAALYFVHSSHAEQRFFTLKEQTFDLFSSQMTNLIDETITREGYRSLDVFAFTDPVLSEARFLFALIGDSLYEFHVATEKESLVQGLILEVGRVSKEVR